MRDLSSMIEAALESEEGKMFWFLELGFDTPLRYTDCDVDLWIPDADEYIDNPDSLVGLWRFNEGSGSVAVDGSGNGLDGTLVNMEDADWVDGISGKCLSFDGVDEYVDCGDVSNADWVGLTVLAWIKWDGTVDTDGYVGPWYKGTTGLGRFLISRYGSIIYQNGNGNFSAGAGAVPTDEWCLLTYSYNQTEEKEYLYVNGVEKASQARTGDISQNASTFLIGKGQVASMDFAGQIDEVRIYSTALTASEIKALYDNPGQFTINKYETMPFSISAVNYSAKSSVDKVEIEIGNVDLQMSAVFLSEDIMNKWGTLKVGFFDSDNQIIDQTFKVFEGLVSTWKLTEPKASITFVNEFVLWNKKTLRKYQSACRWPFKSTECGYTGAETWCDQGYARCTALDNTDNFSGFRWLPDLMEKQIYWGKTT